MAAIFNQALTLTALTPLNLATGVATAPDGIPFIVYNLLVQMKTGGTGRGYVMAGIYNKRIPVITVSADLSMELAPATSTAPGGAYTRESRIDLQTVWIDGSHTGDVVTVSYERD